MSTTRRPPPSLHRTEMLLAHREWLLALARHLVRDEHLAEDLVQDTWMAALRRPPEDRGAARGWLATVMRNLAGKALRARGRRKAREERVATRAASSGTSPSVDEICAEAELQTRLTQAALSLPPLYRDPVILRYFEGLALRDVAERLGVPPETARTRIKRALAQLREELWGSDRPDGRTVYAGFLTMVSRHEVPPVPSAPDPGSSLAAIAAGGLVMLSKGKIAAAVVLVLLLIGAGVVATSSPDVPEPPRDAAVADVGDETEARRRRRPDAPSEDAAPAPSAEFVYTSGTPVDLDAVDRARDLHGTVVDPDGRGVGGAELEVVTYPWRRVSVLSHARYYDSHEIARTRSAPDGTFAIRLPRGADLALRVRATGFATFEVGSVQAGERLRLELAPAVKLIIDAVDLTGASIPGVQVRVFQTGPSARSRTFLRRAVTDDDGRAVFDGLPSGEPVMIDGQHERLGSPGWERETLPESGETVYELLFPPSRTLTGRVTDAVTGEPVPDAVVGRGWPQRLPVTSDADGRFVMHGWTGQGGSDIHVTADGYGREEQPIGSASEYSIALSPGIAVAGRVVDPDGRPVGDVRVAVVGSVMRSGEQIISVGATVADAEGAFRVGSLRGDMPHAIVLTADGYARTLYDFDPPPAGQRDVELGDVILQAPGAIVGVARTSDGAPLARVPVRLRGANEDRGRYRPAGPLRDLRYGQGEECMTDDLGRFTFSELAAGSYEVSVQPRGASGVSETVVLPGPGEVVEVVLEPDAEGRFRVEAVDVAGGPLQGVTVLLFDSRNLRAQTQTGADGTAVLAYEGEPRMLYVRPPEGASAVYLPISPLTPKRGQTEARFVFEEAGTISGVVRDARGEPIPNAMLDALRGEDEVASGHADATGRFTITVPASGTFDLRLNGKALVRRGASIETPEIFVEGGLSGVGAGARDVVVRARAIPTDGEVNVRVVSPDGKPLPDVPVYVLGSAGPLSRARTAADGRAVLRNVPQREVEVGYGAFGRPPPDPDWVSPAFVKTRPGAEEVTLRFRRSAWLRGVVVDHEGRPAPKATVLAYYGRTAGQALTDAQGRFELRVAEGATGIRLRAQLVFSPGRWTSAPERTVSASHGEIRLELDRH